MRDDLLLRNPAEFVTAPPVHEEGQKRNLDSHPDDILAAYVAPGT